MPYIESTQRKSLEKSLNDLFKKISLMTDIDARDMDGVLNYIFTETLLYALNLGDNPRYTKINTAIGVLECVKLELYRRLGGEYENTAINKSGDIDGYKQFNNWMLDK